MMLNVRKILLVGLVLLASVAVSAQEEIVKDSGAAEAAERMDKVTAVYGVTADDYLVQQEAARGNTRVKYRGRRGGQPMDLPDAFYFIGGPVFFLILLRVLVIFITTFEEMRKEEENQMASEHFNPD